MTSRFLKSIPFIRHILDSSERSRSVSMNAGASLFVKVIAMLIQFVQVPVVLSYLDDASYGVYLTISSIVLWTQNFDFGLGQGLRYKLTQAISLGQTEIAKKLVSTSYVSLSVIMGSLLIILCSICPLINWQDLFNYTECDNIKLTGCVTIVLASFLIRFVLEMITYILQANQRTAISTIFHPIANIISVIGVLVLKIFSYNSLILACAMLAIPYTLVILTANLILFAKRYRSIAPGIKDYDKNYLKDIYSLGLKFFVSSLAGLVIFNTSNILISHYLSPADTTVYNTAFMYMGAITTFIGVLSTPMMAGITDAFVKNDLGWLRNSFRKFSQITIFGCICIFILMAISPLVYKIWLGHKLFIPFSVTFSLAIYFIGNLWSSQLNCYVTGAGKAYLSMVISWVKIICFIPITILLMKWLGLIGLILSTILVNTLPTIFICAIQSKMIINGTLFGVWNK